MLLLPNAFQDQPMMDISKCEVVKPEINIPCDFNKLDDHDWSELDFELDEVNIPQTHSNLADLKQSIGRSQRTPECDDYSTVINALPPNGLKTHLLHYSSWDELDGNIWEMSIREFPHLSKYCDWTKLDDVDWVWLLRAQPQYGEHCDLSKLSTFMRQLLAVDQPQFA